MIASFASPERPGRIFHLHLPSDGVTIWYTVLTYEGQEIVSIQHVRVDT